VLWRQVVGAAYPAAQRPVAQRQQCGAIVESWLGGACLEIPQDFTVGNLERLAGSKCAIPGVSTDQLRKPCFQPFVMANTAVAATMSFTLER
jgi:hypothetical protein